MTTDAAQTGVPPYDADALRWDKEAADKRHKALDDARARAGKWEATVTTLLGLFSTVAVIAGPSSIDKVPTEWVRWVALVLVLAAGIAAGRAILYAARAAQGPDPQLLGDLDGETLEVITLDRVARAVEEIRLSRQATFVAIGLLFATGLLVAADAARAAGEAPSGSSVVVIDGNGKLVCGKIAVGATGEVTVGGRDVGTAKDVVPVTSCAAT